MSERNERAWLSVVQSPLVYLATVRYHGPTDTKGARVSVRCPQLGRFRLYPYDHGASNPYDAAVVRWLGDTESARVTCIGRAQEKAGHYTYVMEPI